MAELPEPTVTERGSDVPAQAAEAQRRPTNQKDGQRESARPPWR